VDRKFEDYLAYLCAVRGLAERTVRSYREDLAHFEIFLASRIGSGLATARVAPVASPSVSPTAPESVADSMVAPTAALSIAPIAPFVARPIARKSAAAAAEDGADPDLAGPRELRAFAASLVAEGKAGSSVNRALSAVRGYYRFRLRFGSIAVDPSRDIEGLPGQRSLPHFLFENEATALMDEASGEDFRSVRDRALLEFLYSTGCRVGEACGLALDGIDLTGGTARVLGKGSKERVVFLAAPAKAAVSAYLGMRKALLAGRESVWLFINTRGGRLSERGAERIVDARAQAAGIEKRVSPHAIRHSFATHVVAHGADIRAVQELLGHASVSTTQIYAHVDMERLKKVYDLAHPHGGATRTSAAKKPRGTTNETNVPTDDGSALPEGSTAPPINGDRPAGEKGRT